MSASDMAASQTGSVAISGIWHPPGTSRAVPAALLLEDGIGKIMAAGSETPLASDATSALSVSSRVGSIPRKITFADGSLFETSDNDAVDRWLKAHRGRRWGFVHELERFHPRLVVMVALVVLFCIGLYRYALPALVEVAVAVTPPVAPQVMSRSVLASLDQTVLDVSTLPEERRNAISAGFEALAALAPRGREGYKLNFRRGGAIGPNAFALPDGTIVITDELIAIAEDEDAVLGVLAHEIGHVEHEHSLRRLYRAAGVTALIMLIGGDVGAGAEDLLVQGSALATLSYSREQERDADRYSVELMAKAGRDPAAIVRFFEILAERLGDRDDNDFFSTHPATPARIEETRLYAEEVAGK